MAYERRPRTERGRFRLTPRIGFLIGLLGSICLQILVLVMPDEPLTFSLTLAGVVIACAVVHGLFAAWAVSRRKRPARIIPLEEHKHTYVLHYEVLGLCIDCPECHRRWHTRFRVDMMSFGLGMLLLFPLAFGLIPFLTSLQTLNNEHLSFLLYMDASVTAAMAFYSLANWLVYCFLRRKADLSPYVGTERTDDWRQSRRITDI